MDELLALGIDTSNYKTSTALVREGGGIVLSLQKLLPVRRGERGLRQSEAFFLHIDALPPLIEKVFKACGKIKIGCVSASDRPRPIPGSYMPVFRAGLAAGQIIASALDVPFYAFSHQEGHIEAIRFYSPLREKGKFISFHFSGGTTEALLVTDDKPSLIGGTEDLALGQVIDRIGVALGMAFPAGDEMDRLALSAPPPQGNCLAKIRVKGGKINLSGIETQCRRLIGTISPGDLAHMLFERLSGAIAGLCVELAETHGTGDFLFAGGVSSSRFIRKALKEQLKGYGLYFGDPALSGDNAVGTALLGGKKIWR